MRNGEEIREKLFYFWHQPNKPRLLFGLMFFLLVLNISVWGRISRDFISGQDLEIFALAVGQGDSQLVKFPGGAKLLIDGGPPNGRLLEALADVLPTNDRYVDLIMISHPQLDHFGGLTELLRRYEVGLILTNGQESDQPAYSELEKIATEKRVDFLALAKGDSVSFLESRTDILWPIVNSSNLKNPNDDALVAAVSSNNATVLFTGDIPAAVERRIAGSFNKPISVLKVAHHGSKNSSDADFLAQISPKLALIGVGKNSYGHPTPIALDRLKMVGAAVYRTDTDGTVKLVIDGKKIQVFRDIGRN
ncbi:MAG: MBL fold metallo-hydrolase [Candidatus Azambacteria bacterium]|nr:MBL fold metallo-hydrolase [Candidatus Azambacteria bacterium]